MKAVQADRHQGTLPGALSFFQVEPPELVLSAVKRSEVDNRLIVRLYNSSASPVEGTLTSFFPVAQAHLATLAETVQEELPVSEESKLTFTAPPWQAVTLALTIARSVSAQ